MAESALPDLELVIAPDKVLSTPCKEVSEITPELKRLAHSMVRSMREHDGIGLAAPQVGESVQLAVVDFHRCTGILESPLIMFNPVIVRADDRKKMPLTEGCLSLPGGSYLTQRHAYCTVRYKQMDGYHRTLAVKGILAVCVQHEIDHLKGKTVADIGTPLTENTENTENDETSAESEKA